MSDIDIRGERGESEMREEGGREEERDRETWAPPGEGRKIT